VIKFGRPRWTGPERGKLHKGFWWKNLSERDHLKDLGIDGRVMLKWAFKKLDGGARTGPV
jgi:hypothetical protein